MSNHLSRRALFPALVAAPATLGAATVGDAQRSPDAELLGLLDQFTKAGARYREIEAEAARCAASGLPCTPSDLTLSMCAVGITS